MPSADARRPASLLVAAAGAAVAGLAVIASAVAAVAVGHGDFSGGVGLALAVYGAMLIVAAVALWRRSVFGRGPVVALSLLNVAAAWTFADSAPWMWLVAAVCAVTAVAAALPATTRALHLRSSRTEVSAADEPRRTDEPGK